MNPFHMSVDVGSTMPASWPNLKFQKDGDEIKTAIDRKVAELAGKIETARLRVGEICTEAQIDAKAFLAGTGDEREALLNAALDRVTKDTNSPEIIAKAGDGAQLLRRWTKRVDHLQLFVDDLLAVKKNIESKRKFDLTFSELIDLGFAI